MNGLKSPEATWIPKLCRLHAVALVLYPRSHRERWGEEIQQVFRDRCREAKRGGAGPWRIGLTELLPDLVVGVCRERFVSPSINSQPGGPMHKFIGRALVLIGASLLALSATALWNAFQGGRFAHAGAFDALGLLQIAIGVAGLVLSAMGMRQARSNPRPAH